MRIKLTDEDINIREFNTHDYRLQIKRPLSKPCYELKKQILEWQRFYDNYFPLYSMEATIDPNSYMEELKDKAEKYMKMMEILSLKEGVDEFEYIRKIIGESH